MKHHSHTIDTLAFLLGDPQPDWAEGRLVLHGDPLDDGSRKGPREGTDMHQRPLPLPTLNAAENRFVPPEGMDFADPLLDFSRVGYDNGAEAVFIPLSRATEFEIHGTEGRAFAWDDGEDIRLRRKAGGSDTEEKRFVASGESPTVNTIHDLVNELETGERTSGNIDVTHQGMRSGVRAGVVARAGLATHRPARRGEGPLAAYSKPLGNSHQERRNTLAGFITRPVVTGRKGVVTSGHYLATAAGFRIMENGGNAIDAAAAMCIAVDLMEPQSCGIGGEVPTLIYPANEGKVYALSGLGWSPQAFTIDWCRENDIDLIPGDGYLPITVPAVVGTWAEAVARWGNKSFSEILAPTIDLAENGYALYEGLWNSLVGGQRKFTELYPSTGEVYLPNGEVPEIGDLVRNPDYAEMLRIMCRAEEAAKGKGRDSRNRGGARRLLQGRDSGAHPRFHHHHAGRGRHRKGAHSPPVLRRHGGVASRRRGIGHGRVQGP